MTPAPSYANLKREFKGANVSEPRTKSRDSLHAQAAVASRGIGRYDIAYAAIVRRDSPTVEPCKQGGDPLSSYSPASGSYWASDRLIAVR